jgi:hypothetical protein
VSFNLDFQVASITPWGELNVSSISR